MCVCDNGGREKLLTYDACHNLTGRKEKTAEGHYIEKTYDYDAKGRLIREPDGKDGGTAGSRREAPEDECFLQL